MAENRKINWLVILQGWAMLWVVIGHSPLGEPGAGPGWESVLYHFAYSFHMPLFMLVSGWLFYLTRLKPNESNCDSTNGGGQWSYNKIIKDKVVRLLLPGFVFSLVAFVLKISFPSEMTRQVGIGLGDIAHAYLYPNDNPMRELWFIATLFWFFVVTPFWNVVLKKRWLMWLALATLIILHFFHPTTGFLCIGSFFDYALWFYLGIIISKTVFVENVLRNHVWAALVLGLVIYVFGVFTMDIITTFGGIIISFSLALIADTFIPRLFYSFRNYTYQIFLMGIFAQMFVKIIFRHVDWPYTPTFLLCILMGLYVPVIVSKIIEIINWKPLLLCVGLKKK